jgi:hypothetical protein
MFASCTGWAWPSSSLKIGKRIDPENVSWMDAYRWMKTKPSLILLQWSAGEQCAAYFETGEKDPTIFGKVSWLVENDLSSIRFSAYDSAQQQYILRCQPFHLL